jgi:hypothetical protein
MIAGQQVSGHWLPGWPSAPSPGRLRRLLDGCQDLASPVDPVASLAGDLAQKASPFQPADVARRLKFGL